MTRRRGSVIAALMVVGALAMTAPQTVLAKASPVFKPFAKPFLRAHWQDGPPTTAECEQQFGIACYAPFQIQQAYDMNPLYAQGLSGEGKTIAIVDAFGAPNIKADLAQFDSDFNLPSPPDFDIIQPAGAVQFDPSDPVQVNWAFETSLDVEWAHSMAPLANILLVETPVAETEGVHGFPDIIKAENYVIDNHLASVISQSFGATEQTFTYDRLAPLRSANENAMENHVTMVAGTGDAGATNFKKSGKTFYQYPVTAWPSSDPLTLSIGGTQLHLDADGNRTAPDNVWNDQALCGSPCSGGGGSSIFFKRPDYQNGITGVGNRRGQPDISLTSAIDGGAIVLIDIPEAGISGYYIVGGVSWATPVTAGIVAIADQAAGHDLGYINPQIYALAAAGSAAFTDVTLGNNTVTFTQGNKTFTVKGFKAHAGYDQSSGLGTIDGYAFVHALAAS